MPMQISAVVLNKAQRHEVLVTTNQISKIMTTPSKPDGTSVNGGELLFLALATCVCNEEYREAAKKNLKINSVEVVVLKEEDKSF